MPDSDHSALPEDPSDRFRRLISEAEEEAENVPDDLPLQYESSESVGDGPDSQDHPSDVNGEADQTVLNEQTGVDEDPDQDPDLSETSPSRTQIDVTGIDPGETRPSPRSRQEAGP